MGSIIAALLGVVGGASGQTTPPDGYTNAELLTVSESGWYSMVRGVDVFEDGIVWSVAGQSTVQGSTGALEESIRARFTIDDASAFLGGCANLPFTTDLSTSTATFFPTLPAYSLTRLWPNDLACHDPSNRSVDEIWMAGVGVGGWQAGLGAGEEEFEGGDGDEGPVPTGYTGTHAWLYNIVMVRDSYCSMSTDSEDLRLTTFLSEGDAGNGVDPVDARVVINAVDTIPFIEITIDNYDPGVPGGILTGGEFRGIAHFVSAHTLNAGVSGSTTGFSKASNNGSLDMFLAAHDFFGAVQPFEEFYLTLGGPGDDAILGVSYNENKGEVVVCGYFSQTVDFDPSLTSAENRTAVGGTDMFVASYSFQVGGWTLNWVWADPAATSANERAEGVWFDIAGDVFVTGWTDGSSTGTSDLVFVGLNSALLDADIPDPRLFEKTVASSTGGTIKGLDICVDGIGRPVLTGELLGSASFPTSATTSISVSSTSSGSDAFIARLNPDTGYIQWVEVSGQSADDIGTDVNICQFNSARLAFGGDLGNNGFADVLEHDPDGLNGSHSPDHHITMLLAETDFFADGEGSLSQPTLSYDDVDATVSAIADTIENQVVYGDDWELGTVSLQVVRHSQRGFGAANPNTISNTPAVDEYYRASAVQTIPITTIHTTNEAKWFVERLRALSGIRFGHTPLINAAGQVQGMQSTANPDSGVLHAADYFRASPLLSYQVFGGDAKPGGGNYPLHATDRHLLMPVYNATGYYWAGGSTVSGSSNVSLYLAPDTRTHVTSDQGSGGTLPPMFDQINAIAMNHYTAGVGLAGIVERDDMFSDVTDSNIKINPPVQGEKNIGFAAEAQGTSTVLSAWLTTIADNGASSFESILDRMFLRMTVCPGDYNRVSGVQATPTIQTGVDWNDFVNAYTAQALYADWNFDGGYSTNPTTGTSGDWAKFFAGFSAGCP